MKLALAIMIGVIFTTFLNMSTARPILRETLPIPSEQDFETNTTSNINSSLQSVVNTHKNNTPIVTVVSYETHQNNTPNSTNMSHKTHPNTTAISTATSDEILPNTTPISSSPPQKIYEHNTSINNTITELETYKSSLPTSSTDAQSTPKSNISETNNTESRIWQMKKQNEDSYHQYAFVALIAITILMIVFIIICVYRGMYSRHQGRARRPRVEPPAIRHPRRPETSIPLIEMTNTNRALTSDNETGETIPSERRINSHHRTLKRSTHSCPQCQKRTRIVTISSPLFSPWNF